MDEQAVSQDHDGDETKALGIVRTISKGEIAELATDRLDCQDRHAACGYEVAPSTLALERGQMLCGVLDGYGPSEYDGTPTLTLRRAAGSMWIVVPWQIAQQCERSIDTEVGVGRSHPASRLGSRSPPRRAPGRSVTTNSTMSGKRRR